MYGRIHTAALRAIAELDVAGLLADGPHTPEDPAAHSATHAGSLRRVLRLLAVRGLFHENTDGTLALTDSGHLPRADVPGSQRAAVPLFTGERFRRAGRHWPHRHPAHRPGQIRRCLRACFPAMHAAPADGGSWRLAVPRPTATDGSAPPAIRHRPPRSSGRTRPLRGKVPTARSTRDSTPPGTRHAAR
ncbi:methyltransferase family protein [Streptomyces sp. KLMMK]|uniref:methyltransferase family protein n=1 Tax=Streptomyces sp. KLMMK TaxID=3109353 RepID=UPI003FA7C514